MIHIKISSALIILIIILFCIVATVEGSVNIVPLGDSITRGSSNDDGHSHGTYRYWLWKHLQESGYDVDFVGSTDQPHLPYDFDQDHEGHSGYRACDFVTDARLKNLLSGYSPDIALVLIGTNDVMTGVPAESTIQNLDAIVDTLREKNQNIVILLGTVIPREGYLDEQRTLNSAMVRLAERKSTTASPVMAVDQFSGYDCHDDSQPTIYLHPNDCGDQKIADRFYTALLPYLSGRPEAATTAVTEGTTAAPESTSTGPLATQTQSAAPMTTSSDEPAATTTTVSILPGTGQTPESGTDSALPSSGSDAVSPFGGQTKQYLIGDQTSLSLGGAGRQSWSSASSWSDGLESWETGTGQTAAEPPATLFIRWYPGTGAVSRFH